MVYKFLPTSADLSVKICEGQVTQHKLCFGYIVRWIAPSTNVEIELHIRVILVLWSHWCVLFPNPGLHRAGSNGSNDNGYFSGGNAPGLAVFTNV